MARFSRRDFLKIGSALYGAFTVRRVLPALSQAASRPNILIFVFDAMSAKNLSLYGYPRKTTPNIERFAARATVYNQHYSAAHFTTPGTASLLTGLYPWTHRAINYSGLVARGLVGDNIFRVLGKEYSRLAYSQNMWANYLFAQFQSDIEQVLSPASFSLVSGIAGAAIARDLQESQRAFDDFLFKDGAPPASLAFGLVERILTHRGVATAAAADHPLGLPHTVNYPIYFKLRDVFDGMIRVAEGLPPPFAAYFHIWSPHAPFAPTKDFYRLFADGWSPQPKPYHKLGQRIKAKTLDARRQSYDEYIANVDFEFGRLLDVLEAKGVLKNTHVVVTSDHGEMQERGTQGHLSPLMFDPVIRVPLIISSPGQVTRNDINVPTSSVDVLPTLAHLSGSGVPSWAEGQVLPGLGGNSDPQRSTYMMDANKNSARAPLRQRAAFALRKGPYKLICYKGFREYKGQDTFELYDIENDPEELKNLYSDSEPLAAGLRAELMARVDAENAKFAR